MKFRYSYFSYLERVHGPEVEYQRAGVTYKLVGGMKHNSVRGKAMYTAHSNRWVVGLLCTLKIEVRE